MSAEQRAVADALINGPRGAVRGPFPALLRRPELADRARAMGDYIRAESVIALPLREIAILAVAQHWRAAYEWEAHVKIARDIGMDSAIVEDIKAGRRPEAASADQKLVFDFCRELLQTCDVSDATFALATERLGEDGVVDLTGIVGYFSFTCMVFNMARVAP